MFMLGLLPSSAAAEKRPSDKERGEELYERHCVQCHGQNAGGDGPAAADLVATVPNLRGNLSKEPTEAQLSAIKNGVGAMPGFSMSFDKHDAGRVMRQMIRLSNQKSTIEEPPKAEDSE